MQPIPVYFENVRRSALVVKHKQPFIDWLQQLDPEGVYSRINDDPDVYLLPDFDEIKEIESWLKKNFDLIFTDQLNNWYINDSLWVKNRTFKMFKEWFDYSLHTMIWDTLEEPIDKD
jgi:hypothetical protein